MSVSHTVDPGCSALGHLFRPEGDRRVCITCGHIEATAQDSPDSATDE